MVERKYSVGGVAEAIGRSLAGFTSGLLGARLAYSGGIGCDPYQPSGGRERFGLECFMGQKDHSPRGGGRLHQHSNYVTVPARNGRGEVKVDKRERPEDVPLVQYVMEKAGVNHKVASRAIEASAVNGKRVKRGRNGRKSRH